jgi:hypothetical protein
MSIFACLRYDSNIPQWRITPVAIFAQKKNPERLMQNPSPPAGKGYDLAVV